MYFISINHTYIFHKKTNEKTFKHLVCIKQNFDEKQVYRLSRKKADESKTVLAKRFSIFLKFKYFDILKLKLRQHFVYFWEYPQWTRIRYNSVIVGLFLKWGLNFLLLMRWLSPFSAAYRLSALDSFKWSVLWNTDPLGQQYIISLSRIRLGCSCFWKNIVPGKTYSKITIAFVPCTKLASPTLFNKMYIVSLNTSIVSVLVQLFSSADTNRCFEFPLVILSYKNYRS